MRNKLFLVLSLVIVASFILGACAQPAPEAPAVDQKAIDAAQAQIADLQAQLEAAQAGGTDAAALQAQLEEAQKAAADAKAAAEAAAAEAAAAMAPEAKAPVLRINIGTYPDVIDPQKSSFVNEIGHLKLIYEGLTKQNEKLETIPGAAESWVFNDAATELTFTLKEGLTYSDGVPLNAKRFEYALQRNIDPTTAGEYASITDEILGAPEWRGADTAAEGYDPETFKAALGVKASHADGAECNADDPYGDVECNTFKLTFSKPAPYFATIAGIWVGFPARQELIEEGGPNWWNSSVYQIGNGPFVLESLEPFVRGFFTPNASYAGDVPQYDLEYSYITDSAVAFEAYKNNEFEVVDLVGEDFEVVMADPDLSKEALVYAGACTIVIKLGLEGVYKDPNGVDFDSPFKDKKVREAFAFAFDAETWAVEVDSGLSAATWTWIPPGFPGYDADYAPYKFDPAKAVEALAASTYAGPEALNALGLKLTYGDSPRNKTRSEFLVNNYKEVLGVDIALDPVESTTFTALTKDPKTFPLLARQGWCADYPDPQNWLSVYWKSDTSFASRQGYVNLEFDALVTEADGTVDPVKRMELYKQAQRLLLDDAPSAFGYNTTNSYLVKPWVLGILTTPQDSDWPGSFAPASITIDTAMMP